jgi:hypothetical protein
MLISIPLFSPFPLRNTEIHRNEESHTPTAFTPEPVRRRVAGMKQILLMIAVVAAQSGSM